MRLQNIILTELIHKRLVAYEKLERAMNSTDNIDKSSKTIKSLLKKISKLTGMISEWQGIIESNKPRPYNLNEEIKKEENE